MTADTRVGVFVFQGGNRTKKEQDSAKLIKCVSLRRLGANGPLSKAEVCTNEKLC